jgi:hypothetical protein
VQVICAPGANDGVAGQFGADIVPEPVNAPSATLGLVNVTLPVLVTRNEYVTTSPAKATVAGAADFTSEIAGAGGAVTVVFDGGDVTSGPVGGVPVAVAVFVTCPASTSACVTEYVAVHVTETPGASDAAPAGHDTADNVPVPEKAPSVTVTFVRVVLPEFVTRNE